MFEIVPVEIYSDADLDWTDKDSRVSREHDNMEEGHSTNERNVPLVSDTVDNWNEYDTVFIGYAGLSITSPQTVSNTVTVRDMTGADCIKFLTVFHAGAVRYSRFGT